MTIKAIIFDMDGVLIDAKDWHYDSLNQALSLFGYCIGRQEHLALYDGLPTTAKLKRLSVEKKLPNCLHSFIHEMKQRYTVSMIHNRCRPRFNHEYALSRLKKEGYRLVVASNSIRSTVDTMMEKSSLQEYLEFSLSNQDVSSPKPSPEIYKMAIKKLGVLADECLVVEDNEYGIKAAQDANAHLLVVKSVEDVNYAHIKKRISEIERLKKHKENVA